MMLYELINPSDPYTFCAPSIEVAGVAVMYLSTSFGARPIGPDAPDETTPILFGWNEWLDDRGIDSKWIRLHTKEIAEALESFLIGDAEQRADVESMLALLPEGKREQWILERQERLRSSVNDIGGRAYKLANLFRGIAKMVE